MMSPKYAPGVTIVGGCGGELVGVGANVAFNNQGKKGCCVVKIR